MNLSQHFTLEEFTRSELATRLGIDNTPSDQILDALYNTAAGMERVRTVLDDVECHITSGYRCLKLNAALHSKPTGQHPKGEAADFVAPKFGTPLQVCREILKEADFIDFDQMIFEGTWVHISFSDTPRREVLTAHFNGGRVTYTKGLP